MNVYVQNALGIVAEEGIKSIRVRYDGDGRWHLRANTGERRILMDAPTVLADAGWPKRGKRALMWVHSEPEEV